MIKIPPLRDRENDIPLLVANQPNKFSLKFDKNFLRATTDFIDRLKRYSWPGNVRELEQVITRHAIIEEKPVLERNPALLANIIPTKRNVSFDKSEAAQKTLVEAGHNKTKAASALGISRKTLYQWFARDWPSQLANWIL